MIAEVTKKEDFKPTSFPVGFGAEKLAYQELAEINERFLDRSLTHFLDLGRVLLNAKEEGTFQELAEIYGVFFLNTVVIFKESFQTLPSAYQQRLKDLNCPCWTVSCLRKLPKIPLEQYENFLNQVEASAQSVEVILIKPIETIARQFLVRRRNYLPLGQLVTDEDWQLVADKLHLSDEQLKAVRFKVFQLAQVNSETGEAEFKTDNIIEALELCGIAPDLLLSQPVRLKRQAQLAQSNFEASEVARIKLEQNYSQLEQDYSQLEQNYSQLEQFCCTLEQKIAQEQQGPVDLVNEATEPHASLSKELEDTASAIARELLEMTSDELAELEALQQEEIEINKKLVQSELESAQLRQEYVENLRKYEQRHQTHQRLRSGQTESESGNPIQKSFKFYNEEPLQNLPVRIQREGNFKETGKFVGSTPDGFGWQVLHDEKDEFGNLTVGTYRISEIEIKYPIEDGFRRLQQVLQEVGLDPELAKIRKKFQERSLLKNHKNALSRSQSRKRKTAKGFA